MHRGADADCWEWQGALSRGGYGFVALPQGHRLCTPGSRTLKTTHRVAYALYHHLDALPALFVCHRCDNPPCGNPHHLWLGTAQDNNRDRLIKLHGRDPAWLTASDVAAIMQTVDEMTQHYWITPRRLCRITKQERGIDERTRSRTTSVVVKDSELLPTAGREEA